MIVEAQQLEKSYGPVHALGPMTLGLPAGPIGLVGPNGAGKTTFLRLLLGLTRPSAGGARVLGHDVATDALRLRERVGYMPEHECLIPTMSGVGLVSYLGQISGLAPSQALSRAHDVLEFVGVGEERYRKISEYSLGMRQRVKLAQALVHDPPLCLLDEPTAGLDPQGRDEMIALLKVLAQQEHRSIILSTHILSDVEGICDRLLVLDGGRVLAEGRLKDLLSLGGHLLAVRVKGDPARFLAGLRAHGIRVLVAGEEIHLERPAGGEREIFRVASETRTQVRHLGSSVQSVEDLFLRLVGQARGGEPRPATAGPVPPPAPPSPAGNPPPPPGGP